MEDYNGKDLIEERKKKFVNFLKQKNSLITYVLLAIIVFIGIRIRTLNIPKLKDISTGGWTLGPDLDPFLFLRWTKYIVQNGSLFAIDAMRSVPLADICSGTGCFPIDTSREATLLVHMMAYFHKFLSVFGLSNDVTYSSILFPVMMFGLTTIAFFLFTRKIFYKQNNKIKNSIAIISTLFFILIPSLLPRTIAGIPEKESAAFFFMFIAFYFFLEAFTSKRIGRGISFGILAGIATAGMGLIWAGIIFIFFTIPAAVLLAFLFGKVRKNEFLVYSSWLISAFFILVTFSERYTLKGLMISLSSGLGISVLFIVGLNLLIIKNRKLMSFKERKKIPGPVFSVIVSIVILIILFSVFFGPGFVLNRANSVKQQLTEPQTSRFGLTVAENKQPYFIDDWKSSFGPIYFNIPLFFWLFFIGSIVLFNSMIKKLTRREKIILTFGYFVFLICLIFSRYSSNSSLNGTSVLSHIVYFAGIIFFIGYFGYYYFKRHKENNFDVFREFNFAYILYFIILTLGIIGARSAIRLVMVLGAVSPVAIAFLIVKTTNKYFKEKTDAAKLLFGILAIIVILASILTAFNYYKADKFTAENFAPSGYHWQWQKAMSWVRENTPQNAVFAHWWDYGYWVQSIGERATILDGGNAIEYWDYLMGRYVLTGTNERDALEFLYTHKATNLLIDSTDIGKYTAFSSIGSNENYDRFSWIQTFLMDETQTQESAQGTNYIYRGASVTDEDITWNQNGKEIFLPRKAAGVGAIILNKDSDGDLLQPTAIFVYNGNQYYIPLRYLFYNGVLQDFETGLDSGVFLFPSLNVDQNRGVTTNEIGAMLYLSKKTIHSELVRLYLFDEQSNYFNLVHSEDSSLVDSLNQQGFYVGPFVHYQGFNGPIRIWEISYPSDIKTNPDYLEIDYPDENLWKVKPGEY
ncbi:MAG: STT3 domain-containing protein [Nanoarchaeota archaeon]|nr:STT3 domain-containing protein [Nanoarchaeota archaeon]